MNEPALSSDKTSELYNHSDAHETNPMDQISFHGLDVLQKKFMLELVLGKKGRCYSASGGMCGRSTKTYLPVIHSLAGCGT